MADPTEPGPVSVDPELSSQLTRVLNIRGPLGLLKVLDTIVPVVSMGDIVTPTITVLQPAFRTTDIFSNGRLTSVVAGEILAGTGPLAAGTYDLKLSMSTNDTVSFLQMMSVEHRNAADTLNLAVWSYLCTKGDGAEAQQYEIDLAIEFAVNERLRIVTSNLGEVGRSYNCTIFARRR